MYSWGEAPAPALPSLAQVPALLQRAASAAPAPVLQAACQLPDQQDQQPVLVPVQSMPMDALEQQQQQQQQHGPFTGLLQPAPAAPAALFQHHLQQQSLWLPVVPVEQLEAAAAEGHIAPLPLAAYGQQQQQQLACEPGTQLPGGFFGHMLLPGQQPLQAAPEPAPKGRSRAKRAPAAKGQRRGSGGGRRKGKQQAAVAAAVAAVEQQHPALAGMPLPPGMATYIQQQQQQEHASALPLLPPLQQLGGGGASQALDPAAACNANSLLNFLDAAQYTLSGFPQCSLLGLTGLSLPSSSLAAPHERGAGGSGGGGGPALGHDTSSAFSLKSWASLSPPSGFGLPADFASPAAAGVGGPPGAAPAPGPPPRPTDFSQLSAKLSGGAPLAATATAPTTLAQRAADALFAQAGAGAPPENADPNPGGRGAPVGAGKITATELTMDFGSLLGVGDNPSWLGAPTSQPAAAAAQQQQQQQGLTGTAATGGADRPWGALFGGN